MLLFINNNVSVLTTDLLNGHKTVCNLVSCEYSNSITYEDLTHKNFGDLYVIERDKIEENKTRQIKNNIT